MVKVRFLPCSESSAFSLSYKWSVWLARIRVGMKYWAVCLLINPVYEGAHGRVSYLWGTRPGFLLINGREGVGVNDLGALVQTSVERGEHGFIWVIYIFIKPWVNWRKNAESQRVSPCAVGVSGFCRSWRALGGRVHSTRYPGARSLSLHGTDKTTIIGLLFASATFCTTQLHFSGQVRLANSGIMNTRKTWSSPCLLVVWRCLVRYFPTERTTPKEPDFQYSLRFSSQLLLRHRQSDLILVPQSIE